MLYLDHVVIKVMDLLLLAVMYVPQTLTQPHPKPDQSIISCHATPFITLPNTFYYTSTQSYSIHSTTLSSLATHSLSIQILSSLATPTHPHGIHATFFYQQHPNPTTHPTLTLPGLSSSASPPFRDQLHLTLSTQSTEASATPPSLYLCVLGPN